MGGTLAATSELGRGSTFSFELELPEADEAIARHTRRRDAHVAPRTVSAAAPVVLAVEDSPVNRIVATSVLKRCGYNAHAVNDGLEALDALAARSYDAVLMDCQMPGLDGYETTRELRRREDGGERTPIIAMIAHAMTGDRERCLAAGMDDYVTKPMRSQALSDTLARWIGRDAPVAA
jgi:CheY-like chemotaxis protein